MPGRASVKQEKLSAVDALAKEISSAPVVGMLDVFKVPAIAIQIINHKLNGTRIKVIQKNVLMRALEKTGEKAKLKEFVGNYPGIILSNLNPFKLNKEIEKNKTAVAVKAGDIAASDIEVKSGPTGLMPGPAITTLSAAKILAKVEGGKIAVIRDIVVCKKGDTITPQIASALQLLGLKPVELGVNMLCAYEKGITYEKNILAIDEAKTLADITAGAMAAMNLSINAGYVTNDNVRIIITKAFNEARELCLLAEILSQDIIGDVLAKAVAEMKELEVKTGPVEGGN